MNLHRIALDFLLGFFQNPELNLRLLLNRYLNSHPLREKKAFTRMIYGIIRNNRFLDILIKRYARPRKLEQRVRILLQIGIFEIFFARSIPDHATVNEIVNLAKKPSRGLINAVLRSILRDKSTVSEKEIQAREVFLTSRFIHPLLLQNLTALSHDPVADLEFLYREPAFHIKPNRRKMELKELARRCEAWGIPYTPLPAFSTLEIASFHPRITRLLQEKGIYVQNTGSQLICEIVLGQAGSCVLDLCAAPGTKLITLHQKNPNLTLLANDLRYDRLKLAINSTASFFGKNPFFVVSDGSRTVFREKVPFILLDAPCSSTGTLRKNPDINLKITRASLRKNQQVQMSLLESSTRHFGDSRLVYSVCSFMKEETEDVLEHACRNGWQPDFHPLNALLKKLDFPYHQGRYGCYLLPSNRYNNDIFYVSIIKKS